MLFDSGFFANREINREVKTAFPVKFHAEIPHESHHGAAVTSDENTHKYFVTDYDQLLELHPDAAGQRGQGNEEKCGCLSKNRQENQVPSIFKFIRDDPSAMDSLVPGQLFGYSRDVNSFVIEGFPKSHIHKTYR